MFKFWRSSSNSSGSSNRSTDDDNSMNTSSNRRTRITIPGGNVNATTSMEEQIIIGEDTEMKNGYSTPPKQRIMPIDDPDASWNIIKNEQHFGSVPTVVANSSTLEGGHINSYNPSQYTRIVCMSDTHGRHRQVHAPKGDILLHCGDFTNTGEIKSVVDLSQFFASWKQQNRTVDSKKESQVICIAGNHDLTFHPEQYTKSWKWFHSTNGPYDTTQARRSLENCIYLEDESYSHVINKGTNNDASSNESIHIYGSPWQPTFGYNWAFNKDRPDIYEKWDLIPSCTDVLLTHGPPLGRGDGCKHGGRAGCLDLLRQVQDRIRPRIHIFGHIHESYGTSTDGTTLYVNASSMDFQYSVSNPCIVIDLPHDKNLPALVVQPNCTLSHEDLMQWCLNNQYDEFVTFVKESGKKMGGKFFISSDLNELIYYLDLHRRNDVIRVKVLIRTVQMHLRSESY